MYKKLSKEDKILENTFSWLVDDFRAIKEKAIEHEKTIKQNSVISPVDFYFQCGNYVTLCSFLESAKNLAYGSALKNENKLKDVICKNTVLKSLDKFFICEFILRRDLIVHNSGKFDKGYFCRLGENICLLNEHGGLQQNKKNILKDLTAKVGENMPVLNLNVYVTYLEKAILVLLLKAGLEKFITEHTLDEINKSLNNVLRMA